MQKKVVKNLALALTLALVGSFIAPNAQVSFAKKKTPVMSKTKLTMTVGSAKKLVLKKAKGKVTWTSSKKDVASVSSKGIVEAKAKGKTTITAKNKGKKYTCKVTVNPDIVPVIEPTVTYWTCPYCNMDNAEEYSYCPHCGHARPIAEIPTPSPIPAIDVRKQSRDKLANYIATSGTKSGTMSTIKKDLTLNYGSGYVSVTLDNNVLYFKSVGNKMPLKSNMDCYANCTIAVPLTDEVDPRLTGVSFNMTAAPTYGYAWYYVDALPGADYNDAFVTRHPVFMSDIKSNSAIKWFVSRNDYPTLFTQYDVEAYANSFVTMIYLGGNRLLTDTGLGITMQDLGFGA